MSDVEVLFQVSHGVAAQLLLRQIHSSPCIAAAAKVNIFVYHHHGGRTLEITIQLSPARYSIHYCFLIESTRGMILNKIHFISPGLRPSIALQVQNCGLNTFIHSLLRMWLGG